MTDGFWIELPLTFWHLKAIHRCVCDLRKFIIIIQKHHLRESVSCVQVELSVLIITF
jgi:hypothetical protein